MLSVVGCLSVILVYHLTNFTRDLEDIKNIKLSVVTVNKLATVKRDLFSYGGQFLSKYFVIDKHFNSDLC